MQDNLREELIKQFPAEVVELVEPSGKKFYACPTCKRVVTLNESKCAGCSQKGVKTATLKFEVGGDFNKGDCRKCPLSYIAKENNENVYECPLKMRANCKLEIS